MRGSFAGSLLAIAVVAIGLGAMAFFGGSSNPIKCLPDDCVCFNQQWPARYDDGVDVGVGAIAKNPYDTPVSAYQMQSGSRAGKLQAVFFVTQDESSSRLRALVAALGDSGWSIGSDGMLSLADANAHRELLRRATKGYSVALPHVVVFSDGKPLRRFDPRGLKSAQELGSCLNYQAERLGLGFQ